MIPTLPFATDWQTAAAAAAAAVVLTQR